MPPAGGAYQATFANGGLSPNAGVNLGQAMGAPIGSAASQQWNAAGMLGGQVPGLLAAGVPMSQILGNMGYGPQINPTVGPTNISEKATSSSGSSGGGTGPAPSIFGAPTPGGGQWGWGQGGANYNNYTPAQTQGNQSPGLNTSGTASTGSAGTGGAAAAPGQGTPGALAQALQPQQDQTNFQLQAGRNPSALNLALQGAV